MNVKEKLAALEADLRSHAPLLVAYSGGVDSTLLLFVAHRVLGDAVQGIIADSPSFPRQGFADALAQARQLDLPVEVLATHELENPDYASNPPNRCYICRRDFFSTLSVIARERGFAAIAYGENADDSPEERPGSQAAREFGILAPLRRAGLTKAEIRAISRELNLPTADMPSQPCLSTRIPFGTPITREALAKVEAGEAFLRGLGFRNLRVRHRNGGRRAKVQVAPEEWPALQARSAEMQAGLRAVGYEETELDLLKPHI